MNATSPIPERCPNCDEPSRGPYCSRCGQHNARLETTVRGVLSEFLSDVWNFDTRIGRSLNFLLFRPGRLTREYREGKRARFVAPLRLYLAVSVVFFAVFSLRGGTLITIQEKEISRPPEAGSLPEGTGDPAAADTSGVMGRWLAAGVRDPEALNRKMGNRLPQAMFLLVPVFALLLRAFYRRSRLLYLYHLVFALHFHAFAFFVWTLSLLVAGGEPRPGTPGQAVRSILVTVVFIYLFLALKRFYGGGKGKTFVKFVGILAVYGVVFGTALLGLAVLSVWSI